MDKFEPSCHYKWVSDHAGIHLEWQGQDIGAVKSHSPYSIELYNGRVFLIVNTINTNDGRYLVAIEDTVRNILPKK